MVGLSIDTGVLGLFVDAVWKVIHSEYGLAES